MELIKHAAVKSKCGFTFIGKQHADCFAKAHSIGIKTYATSKDQGFMTSKGRFIGRVEAAELAFKNGQIEKKTDLLFSEDLWCRMHNGIQDYSETEGYKPREYSY